MKIVRLNKKNKKDENLSLHIKCKCKCGCKVIIDDITDLVYVNDFCYSYSLFRDTDGVIAFGYICPKCNKEVEIPFRHCKRITRYLYDSGIDIIEYMSKCDWWKPFLPDKDSPAYDTEVNTAIEYFTKYNAPLPREMKSCVMEELFRYSIKSERFRDVLNK